MARIIDEASPAVPEELTTHEWVRACRRVLSAAIERHLPGDGRPLTDFTTDHTYLLGMWALHDAGTAQRWVETRLASGWDLLELLLKLTPPNRLIGSSGERWALGEANLQTFDELIGLERILVELAAQIDAVDVTQMPHREMFIPDTPQARRALVLGSLRGHRDHAAVAPDSAQDIDAHDE